MDPVCPADHDGELMFLCPPREHGLELFQIFQEKFGRLLHLNGQGSVQHIRGGHSEMNKPRFVPDILSHVRQEGNDIVFDLFLDLEDPLDIKRRLLPNCGNSFFRNDSESGLLFTCQQFDLKPDSILVFVFPDLPHCGAGIALDHWRSPCERRPMVRVSDVVFFSL